MDLVELGKSVVAHVDFSTKQREKLADQGEAMPDGSYPIRNRADLQRAIQAFGRASDKVATKRWIIKRAKELDAEDLLPETWTKDAQHMDMTDFLEHYGVKGMRWGVRKRRDEGERKRTFSRSSRGKGSQQKSVKDFSDEELRRVVNRLNMEQQYTRLSSGRSGSRTNRLITAGASFVAGIALNVARQQISNAANKQVGEVIARRAARKVSG